MGKPGCACARAPCGANANSQANRKAIAALRLLRIDALEVIEHEASLLRRQPAELVPVRHGELRRRLAAGRRVRRREQLGAGRGLRLALAIVLAFVALERPPGIEHPAEQPLLPVDDVRIQRAAFQRLRELPRLLRQFVGPPRSILVTHLLERRRHFALLAAKLARLLTPLLIELRARPWDQLRGL